MGEWRAAASGGASVFLFLLFVLHLVLLGEDAETRGSDAAQEGLYQWRPVALLSESRLRPDVHERVVAVWVIGSDSLCVGDCGLWRVEAETLDTNPALTKKPGTSAGVARSS